MFRNKFTCQSDTTLHQPFQQAPSESEQPECLLQMDMQNGKVFSAVFPSSPVDVSAGDVNDKQGRLLN